MTKTLVLAEKPSVGKDIGRVLNCQSKSNGHLENNQYIITWAMGHLVSLSPPEAYNQAFKEWRLEDLPIIPEKMKLEVLKKTSKQYKLVKQLLNRKDVSNIIIATDAGREGELVARWIIEKSGCKKPIKRLWISSVTDKAIKDGFNNLKPGKDYLPLYDAAIARAEADWIVGINGTRAITCKHNAQMSLGRVQTPTLAMIYKRDSDIRAFVPQNYYTLSAQYKELTFKSVEEKRSFDKDKIEQIVKKLSSNKGTISKIESKEKKSYAPTLYDLTTLQRDVFNKYGYSPKETLSIMQRLYDSHKVLTYPRTDSSYLTSDMVDSLEDRVKACGTKELRKFSKLIQPSALKGNKHFIDDNKVSDHHAIIPTEEPVYLKTLTHKEAQVYDLVAKRFLAVLMKPYVYKQYKITLTMDGKDFHSEYKEMIQLGYKALYQSSDDKQVLSTALTALKPGDTLQPIKLVVNEHQTKPPQHFTEATLLEAMENPTAFLQSGDASLSKTLKSTGGLGTVATRADIIEKLYNSYVVENKNNKIVITQKGIQLLDLAPEALKSPILTAEWEQNLDAISKSKMKKEVFLQDMKTYTKEMIDNIKNSESKFKHDNLTREKCPECGKYMLRVNGKKGSLLVCQDRECGHKKHLSKVTNARCPNCHKKMTLRGQKDAQTFQCQCGYREKLSSFNKRKSESKKNISNKDAKKYLAKEKAKNKDTITNPALAEALKKLKL